MDGIDKVYVDQCMHGLSVVSAEKVGPAKKATGFMSNSPEIPTELAWH